MPPVRAERAPAGRRAWLLGLACVASVLLAGCSTVQPTQFESHSSFDRTFNMVMAAMADQKMVFSVQDRRRGVVVADLNGDAVKATLEPQYESTIRVSFSAEGDKHADAELLKRVVESYRQRLAGQAHLLPSDKR